MCDAQLVSEAPVEGQTLLVEGHPAIELTEDVDRAAVVAQRVGTKALIHVAGAGEQGPEPLVAFERSLGDPEACKRDGQPQPELDLAIVDGPLERAAEIRLLQPGDFRSTWTIVVAAELRRLSDGQEVLCVPPS